MWCGRGPELRDQRTKIEKRGFHLADLLSFFRSRVGAKQAKRGRASKHAGFSVLLALNCALKLSLSDCLTVHAPLFLSMC